MKVCSVAECERASQVKTLCMAHYKRLREGRDLSTPIAAPQKFCAVKGCKRPHASKSLCAAHYRRQRDGLEIATLIGKDKPRKCCMCGLTAAETPFAKDPGRCAACLKERSRLRRLTPEYALEKLTPEFRAGVNRRLRQWKKRHPEEHKAQKQKRRAAKYSTQVELILPATVFAMDDYICYLCDMPTEPGGPRRMWPTIDHVIPLSRGGPHIYDNLRCAHFHCNASKGNR